MLQMLLFVCLYLQSQRINGFTQAESVRSSLQVLEELLEKYSPLMESSTERVLGKVVKVGAVFAEVRPAIWKTSKTLTVFS